METNDDAADKGRGTTRRRFLGAAAALGLAASTGTSTATTTTDPGPPIDVQRGDFGTVSGKLPERTGLGASLELWNPNDDNASVRVTGYRYVDEEPGIGLNVSMTHAGLSMYIAPEEARTLAADLNAAADHAEGKHVE